MAHSKFLSTKDEKDLLEEEERLKKNLQLKFFCSSGALDKFIETYRSFSNSSIIISVFLALNKTNSITVAV